MAAMGPAQVGTAGKPPVAFPCPRTMPARAQPIKLASHDPLLKPAINTCAWSTQKDASMVDNTASKKLISGESASLVSKHCPTGLRPTSMAFLPDAFCMGKTCEPLPPQPGPRKTVVYGRVAS